MSGTPSQPQRNPLDARSSSQSNSRAAIRIVPYSPPRPLSTSGESASITASAEGSPQRGYAHGSHHYHTDNEVAVERHASSSDSSDPVSPSSAGSHVSLGTAKGRRVSAQSESRSRRPSAPGTPVSDGTPSASPTPTDFSDSNAHVHASRGRDNGKAASSRRPLSRRRNFVTVNSGRGTFSLQPHPAAPSTFKSSTHSGHSLSTQSSLERLSDLFSSEGRPSTPLTTLPERSQASASPCTSASSATHLADDHTGPSTSSPWNYRLVGGLRKVPQTPDLRQRTTEHPSFPPQLSTSVTDTDAQLPPLPESSSSNSPAREESTLLLSKTSFQSSQSASTGTERTNYKIYRADSPRHFPALPDNDSLPRSSSSDSNENFQIIGRSSPPAPSSSVDVVDSDSNSNYQILGRSSPPAPLSLVDDGGDSDSNSNYQILGRSSPPAPSFSVDDAADRDSNSNYQILGRSSPPAPSSIDYSPSKGSESDANYVIYGDPSPAPSSSRAARQGPRSEYSQESLVVPPLRPVKKKQSYERAVPYKSRSRESFRRSSLSSINSILGQEAIQAFLSTPIALNRPGGPPGFSGIPSDPWAAGPSGLVPIKPQMQSHPHQWSSQLSTVFSESEGGSDGLSRSVSPLSAPGQRSSGRLSNHSRQMLSVSSVSAGEETPNLPSQFMSSPVERPQPAFNRASTVRMVRDQDEHGDGLADLHDVHDLHQRPSRRRLASYLSSSSSERNLHSSASSSRSNSFSNTSLPVWARLYYGSGERRWLRQAPSSESMRTDYSEGRSQGSLLSGSPSLEQLPLNIQNPRRRPREMPLPEARPASETGSMVISPAPVQGFPFRPDLRKQTSSVWSPHLGRDQRASGYSVWDPPSVSWSAESGLLGRRNIQVILFIVGFIFPLSWMIAAFLPLPPYSRSEMSEHTRRSLLNVEMELRRVAVIDELQYWSARWWRNLNRIMAVVGLLVIGAVVALVVIGVRQGW